MDFADFWQENKRFVLSVAGGGLALLIGLGLIDRFLGQDLRGAQRSIASATQALKNPMYGASQLADAQAENKALRATVATLSEAVAFESREEFRLRDDAGSASSQFFAITSQTRDDLLRQAGRRGLRLPETLGLPGLSPTSEDEIERTLEGFDVVDRVVRLALETGVERIDDMQIRLDPSLGTRKGVGRIERTRIEVTLSGDSAPLVAFLERTQSDRFGAPLLIEDFEIVPARRKRSEARLDVKFVACRLHGTAEDAEEIDE